MMYSNQGSIQALSQDLHIENKSTSPTTTLCSNELIQESISVIINQLHTHWGQTCMPQQ